MHLYYTLQYMNYMQMNGQLLTLQEALPLKILVYFLVDNISLRVFELFLLLGLPRFIGLLRLELLPKGHCVLDLRALYKIIVYP